MTVKILTGDCMARLAELPDQSVHCCVTSPPYFGLRDYGHDGQIGLEDSPDDYVARLVEVFREVRRVLRDDGTLWLNLGDSYGGSRCGPQGSNGQMATRSVSRHRKSRQRGTTNPGGYKQLLGMPWRLAFALQSDGWYLRQDIIWHKPNPMPESVRDRCTKAHEYLFLLSKSPRYYFDQDAIKEPATFEGPNGRQKSPHAQGFGRRTPEQEKARRVKRSGNKARKPSTGRGVPVDANGKTSGDVAGSVPWAGVTRNKRSVWTVVTRPYPEAHFATYPPELIEPCIRAGSPLGGTVLDPFAGAGTTGLVAHRCYREAVLIELNPEYSAMTERRIREDAGLYADIETGAAG